MTDHDRVPHLQLTEHTRVAEHEVADGYPDISSIQFLNGAIGINPGQITDGPSLSVAGLYAAGVDSNLFKQATGVEPGSPFNPIVDSAYHKAGLSPGYSDANDAVVGRLWHTHKFRIERKVTLPYESQPVEETGKARLVDLPDSIAEIVRHMVYGGHTLAAIQEMPQYRGMSITRTLAEYNRNVGFRSMAPLISLGFMALKVEQVSMASPKPIVRRHTPPPSLAGRTRAARVGGTFNRIDFSENNTNKFDPDDFPDNSRSTAPWKVNPERAAVMNATPAKSGAPEAGRRIESDEPIPESNTPPIEIDPFKGTASVVLGDRTVSFRLKQGMTREDISILTSTWLGESTQSVGEQHDLTKSTANRRIKAAFAELYPDDESSSSRELLMAHIASGRVTFEPAAPPEKPGLRPTLQNTLAALLEHGTRSATADALGISH